MKVRKTICFIAVLAIIASAFLSMLCACGTEGDGKKISVIVPDGAPAIAIARLMDERPVFDGYNVTYTVVPASNIVAKVSSGEADVAVMPTNAAANLYNKGVDVKLVSVNVFGLLYIVGKEDANFTLESLKGKVIHSIGGGNTGEYILKYLLSREGIEYENGDTAVDGKAVIKYYSDGSLILPQLIGGVAEYALLGEPAASVAAKRMGGALLYDMQTAWKEATQSDAVGYPQAGMVVKSGLIESDPDFVGEFLKAVEDSDGWAEKNVSRLAEIMTANGSALTTQYSAEAVKNCNVVFRAARQAKQALTDYFGVFFGFAPTSIGGKMPDDGFYF